MQCSCSLAPGDPGSSPGRGLGGGQGGPRLGTHPAALSQPAAPAAAPPTPPPRPAAAPASPARGAGRGRGRSHANYSEVTERAPALPPSRAEPRRQNMPASREYLPCRGPRAAPTPARAPPATGAPPAAGNTTLAARSPAWGRATECRPTAHHRDAITSTCVIWPYFPPCRPARPPAVPRRPPPLPYSLFPCFCLLGLPFRRILLKFPR